MALVSPWYEPATDSEEDVEAQKLAMLFRVSAFIHMCSISINHSTVCIL